jgi:hypothetical protein
MNADCEWRGACCVKDAGYFVQPETLGHFLHTTKWSPNVIHPSAILERFASFGERPIMDKTTAIEPPRRNRARQGAGWRRNVTSKAEFDARRDEPRSTTRDPKRARLLLDDWRAKSLEAGRGCRHAVAALRVQDTAIDPARG